MTLTLRLTVVVGTTGEDVTFKVCVVEVATAVDDDVSFEAIEILEVRICGDVIRAAEVGTFVGVTRGTVIYDGNNKLI